MTNNPGRPEGLRGSDRTRPKRTSLIPMSAASPIFADVAFNGLPPSLWPPPSTSPGPCASMRASRRPRIPTPSTGATSRRARRPVGRLRSGHRIAATIRPSARGRATSAWPASPSIPSTTCAPVLRHPARPDERVDDHERPVLPVLALYIVAAEEQGVTAGQTVGDHPERHSQEFMVRNTYIYPPQPSMRIISDIFAFTSQHMPKFNSSRSPATTCRKPARRRIWNSPTRSPTASNICARALGPG